MAGNISKLFSHSIVYGMGNFLSKGIMFLLVPILTNTMAPGEFGKFSIVQTFIGFTEVFFVLGMRQAILRYSVKDEYSRSQVFTSGVNWIIMASLISATIMLIFMRQINDLTGINDTSIYRNILIILVVDALANAPFAELQSEQRSLYFMTLRLVHVFVYFGLSAFLVLAKKRTDVNAILTANIAASICQLAAGLPVYAKLFRPTLDKVLMRGMVKFGLPYVPNLIFGIAIDLIDRILIGRWLSLSETGYYSAAYKFANLMYVIVTAFLTAWQPFFLSNLKSEGGPRLFSRVMTYFVLTAALIFMFMGLFYNELSSLSLFGFTVIGPQYRAGLSVVPILLLAYVFCGAYYNLIVGIYAKEKTWFIPLITAFGALLNVGLNYFAIPKYGIKGAAVVTLISYAGMAFMLYPITMKLYFIRYEWGRILKLILVTAVLYVPSILVSSVYYKFIAFFSFLPALYATNFFLTEEKQQFLQLIGKR